MFSFGFFYFFIYFFLCVQFLGIFFLDGLVLSIFTVIKNAYGSCYSQHFRISENDLTFENKRIRIYIIFIKFNSPQKGKMDILYDNMADSPRILNTIVFEFLECSYLFYIFFIEDSVQWMKYLWTQLHLAQTEQQISHQKYQTQNPRKPHIPQW